MLPHSDPQGCAGVGQIGTGVGSLGVTAMELPVALLEHNGGETVAYHFMHESVCFYVPDVLFVCDSGEFFVIHVGHGLTRG